MDTDEIANRRSATPTGNRSAEDGLRARPVRAGELPSCNALIERAVMAWPLAPRVKRCALPLLQYDRVDLNEFAVTGYHRADQLVAVSAVDYEDGVIDGVGSGAVLHGLYVDPSHQGRGLGQRLVTSIVDEARRLRCGGIFARAESVSTDFFDSCGFERIPARRRSDYPYLYWLSSARFR